MSSSYEIHGRTVTMPVEVRDASAGTAIFEVDASAVQALLPGKDFVVVEASPGRAHLVLALVDYRDNDLGDYLEIGVTFFVAPVRGGEAGTFIYKLPVDQEFTRAAGIEVWGFPKSVEAIAFDYTDDRLTASLSMDGEHVLTASIPRGGADPSPEQAMTTYTYIEGRPYSTSFTQSGEGSAVCSDPGAIVLELGLHPLAKSLAELMPRPVLATWTESMRGSFQQPVKLS